MIKSNKSYAKRLKVTRNGKIVARRVGHNHFNAKQSGQSIMAKRRTRSLNIDNRVKRQFISTISKHN